MANHEFNISSEEYQREALRGSITRKIEVLVGGEKIHRGVRVSDVVRIGPLALNEWGERPFSTEGKKVRSAYLRVLDQPWNILGRERFVRRQVSTSSYTSSHYFTDELNIWSNGDLELDSQLHNDPINPDRKIFKASMADLEMFDKALNSAISRTFAQIPWDKQLPRKPEK